MKQIYIKDQPIIEFYVLYSAVFTVLWYILSLVYIWYIMVNFSLHFCWIPISVKKEEKVPGCWSYTARRVLVSWESDPGPSPDAELFPGDGVPAFRLQEVL